MKKRMVSDPMTGISYDVLEMENGSIVVDTAFKGTVTLEYEDGCYQVPKDLLEHVDTISLRECAKLLGVTKMYVSTLCSQGNLESTKVNGVLVINRESAERLKEIRDDRANNRSDLGDRPSLRDDVC